jgi:hypothetical protein
MSLAIIGDNYLDSSDTYILPESEASTLLSGNLKDRQITKVWRTGDQAANGGLHIVSNPTTADWIELGETSATAARFTFTSTGSSNSTTRVIKIMPDIDDSVAEIWQVISRYFSGSGEEKFTEDGGAVASNHFGYSVATYGNYIVVGAPGVSSGAGAVYLYNIDGTFIRKIVPTTPETGAKFGWSVAIHESQIIVGSPNATLYSGGSPLVDIGVAYLFGIDGVQKTQILPSTGSAGSNFGWAVTISANIIAVGGPHGNLGAGTNQGTVHFYTPAGVYQTYRAEGTTYKMGYSLASNGGDVYVGQPDRVLPIAGVNKAVGAVIRFIAADAGGAFAEFHFGVLDGDVDDGAKFGHSVACTDSKVVVGAPYMDNGSNVDSGGAYKLDMELSGAYTKLFPSDPTAGDHFGVSVAVSPNNIVVGSPLSDSTSNTDAGALYIFNNDLVQIRKVEASDEEANDNFGLSMAASDSIIISGAPYEDGVSATDAGAIYTFRDEINVSVGGPTRDWTPPTTSIAYVIGGPPVSVGNTTSGPAHNRHIHLTLNDVLATASYPGDSSLPYGNGYYYKTKAGWEHGNGFIEGHQGNQETTSIQIEFGGQKLIDSLSLLNHNFSGGAKWRVRFATDLTAEMEAWPNKTWGNTTVSIWGNIVNKWSYVHQTDWQDVWPTMGSFGTLPYGVFLWGTNITAEQLESYKPFASHLLLDTAVSAKFIKIDIQDTASPSYFEVGRVVVGKAWKPSRNMSRGWTLTYKDPSKITRSLGGQTYVDTLNKYRSVKFNLKYLTEEEIFENALELDRTKGSSGDVLIYTDTKAPAHKLFKQTIYGRIAKISPMKHNIDGYWSRSYTIEELL